jgi:hypothetical protein
MTARQHQIESILSSRCPELLEQKLQLLVEVQHHLAHQRRPAADLVPQAGRRIGNQANEIESIPLPEALFVNQADQQFELGGLPQMRCLI